jgi:hypothetical protein
MSTEYLEHDGTVWELQSYYGVSDASWYFELTKMARGGGLFVMVKVPDDAIERPCKVQVFSEEQIPQPVLHRLLLETAMMSRHAGVELERERNDPSET